MTRKLQSQPTFFRRKSFIGQNKYLHYRTWSSTTMRGMWAIRCQSSPFQNWHRFFSRGQLLIFRKEMEMGSPSFGRDWRFWQSSMCNFWREVSSWSPLPSRDLRFGRLSITREVRVEGSRPSFGNDTKSWHPHLMLNCAREASPCKPHSTWGVSLSHSSILSEFMLDTEPRTGNNNRGQSRKISFSKEPREHINDLSFLQWMIS